MQTMKQCRLKYKLDTEKINSLDIFQRAFTIEFPVLACMQPAISHFVSDKLTTTTTVKGIQPYASTSCGIAILATYYANLLSS